MYSCFWLFSPSFFGFISLFTLTFSFSLSFVDFPLLWMLSVAIIELHDLLELERFRSELHRKYSVNQMSTRNSLNPVNYISLVENSLISTKLVKIFRCFLTISSEKRVIFCQTGMVGWIAQITKWHLVDGVNFALFV